MTVCGGNAIPNDKAHSHWIETCITLPTLLPLIFLYTSFVKKLNGATVPSQWTRPHSTQLTLLCITCQEKSRFHLIRRVGGPAPSQCKPPGLHQILTAYVSGCILLYPHPVWRARLHCIHHHHKHPGLGHLARSISRVTVALSIVSSVFQLFSFLVGCSGMILKGFGFVAFFAGVKASSFCIHLSCLVCSLSVVCGIWSRLFCGHKGCNLPEVSITSFLPPQFFVSVRLSKSNFLTHTKNVGKTKVLYNFKIVSVLNFLKIVLLIAPINWLVLAPRGIIDADKWYPQILGNYRLT